MDKRSQKCVFFDRDGIVNVPPEPGGYVCRPDDFSIMPEFIESLHIVEQSGYQAIIITNQQGVGKGLYTEQILADIHKKLYRQIQNEGLHLLGIYYCPHLADEDCDCRKPKPGMILKAAAEWNIDLPNSWMVGDSFRDVESGRAAGCQTILVNMHHYAPATICVKSIDKMPSILADVLK